MPIALQYMLICEKGLTDVVNLQAPSSDRLRGSITPRVETVQSLILTKGQVLSEQTPSVLGDARLRELVTAQYRRVSIFETAGAEEVKNPPSLLETESVPALPRTRMGPMQPQSARLELPTGRDAGPLPLRTPSGHLTVTEEIQDVLVPGPLWTHVAHEFADDLARSLWELRDRGFIYSLIRWKLYRNKPQNTGFSTTPYQRSKLRYISFPRLSRDRGASTWSVEARRQLSAFSI